MAKRSAEQIKTESRGLLEPLGAEVADASAPKLSDDAQLVLKFHGSYQQEDRDARKERLRQGAERQWQFMVRTRTPGGRMSAAQYLAIDTLAKTHADGRLRITTRQGFQFHGVGKAKLKPLIRALNEQLVTTQAACGDVARNVTCCPAADLLPGAAFDFQALAHTISERFLPKSTAYYELWLDGERFLSDGTRVRVTPSRDEPLYGPTYLPRKHKIAIGLPHDNCVDVFTNDLALEAVLDGRGELRGFNVLAGGGLGTTHGNRQTIPRLADRVCFALPDDVLPVLDAVTTTYRDFGDRTNRKHARLKYVLEEKGVAWFRSELEARLGRTLPLPEATGPYAAHDHLGIHQQRDGRLMAGVWVESGRIHDVAAGRWSSGLRAIVEAFSPEVRLTPQQNLLLANIDPARRGELEAMLAAYGLSTGDPSSTGALRRLAMACPAMPTCGLAVAEAERALPDLMRRLEDLGHRDDRVVLRMSGCPNSCSRPPTAEIGIIGRSLSLYTVYLGGSFAGTRLARLFRDDVKFDALPALLSEVLTRWKAEREPSEDFGDWAAKTLVPAAPPTHAA